MLEFLSKAIEHAKARLEYNTNNDQVRIKRRRLEALVKVAEGVFKDDTPLLSKNSDVREAILRARVCNLRGIINTQKTYYASAKDKINEQRSKIAELEEKLRCAENARNEAIGQKKYGRPNWVSADPPIGVRVRHLERRVEALENQTVIVPNPDLSRNVEVRRTIHALTRAKKEWRDAPDGSYSEIVIIGRIMRLISKLSYYADCA